MPAIDLSNIWFRAWLEGDINEQEPNSTSNPTSTFPLDLSSIKFRSFQYGDLDPMPTEDAVNFSTIPEEIAHKNLAAKDIRKL